jgi:hypothetical protein
MAESVYCACGAQWHGSYAASGVIEYHRRRSERGDSECRLLTHGEYVAKYPRRCDCGEHPKPSQATHGPRVRVSRANVQIAVGDRVFAFKTRPGEKWEAEELIERIDRWSRHVHAALDKAASVGAVDPQGEKVTDGPRATEDPATKVVGGC